MLTSLVVHAVLIIGVFRASARLLTATPDPLSQSISYFEIVPMEEIRPVPVEELVSDEPEPPESAGFSELPMPEFQPAPLPDLRIDPALVGGFQTLLAPAENAGTSDSLPDGPEVRPEDFRGRGRAGGVPEGQRTVTVEPVAAGPARSGAPSTYLLPSAITQLPSLSNGEEIAKLMSLYYPSSLWRRGEEGLVMAEFVITSTGTVDRGTISIIETSHQEFADATLRFLELLRFEPGRLQGRPVPVLIVFPVQWKRH